MDVWDDGIDSPTPLGCFVAISCCRCDAAIIGPAPSSSGSPCAEFSWLRGTSVCVVCVEYWRGYQCPQLIVQQVCSELPLAHDQGVRYVGFKNVAQIPTVFDARALAGSVV